MNFNLLEAFSVYPTHTNKLFTGCAYKYDGFYFGFEGI